MALRCTKCGNGDRFEVLRQGTMRFAAYRDNRDPNQLYQEKLPLGWELKEGGEYICRACGSHEVKDNGTS